MDEQQSMSNPQIDPMAAHVGWTAWLRMLLVED
jgi:hypothetical protein